MNSEAAALCIKMDYVAHKGLGCLLALRDAGKLEGLTVALGIIAEWEMLKARFEAAILEKA